MHTHLALNDSHDHCRNHLDFECGGTLDIHFSIEEFIGKRNTFYGFWIVPGSPYLMTVLYMKRSGGPEKITFRF